MRFGYFLLSEDTNTSDAAGNWVKNNHLNKKEKTMPRQRSTLLKATMIATLFIAGCSDRGTSPTSSEQQPPTTPPSQTQDVSFRSQIKPIFQQYGCNGCHGGSGGLFVGTVTQLLQGGSHGPAVAAGNADGSNIVKKVSPNPPFGDRMPQGGPFLPDSTIQTIKLWINQGAKDN